MVTVTWTGGLVLLYNLPKQLFTAAFTKIATPSLFLCYRRCVGVVSTWTCVPRLEPNGVLYLTAGIEDPDFRTRFYIRTIETCGLHLQRVDRRHS